MKLKKLLKDLPEIEVHGWMDIDIVDVVADSQRVGPGALFIARRGKRFDGNRFIPEAIASGAACVLSDVYDPSLSHITQLLTDDVAAAEPKVAAAFWQYPSQGLHMVGITGTSGKTTVSYIVRHLFTHFGVESGLMGSVAYVRGDKYIEASHTTPDASTVQKQLRGCVCDGMKACVMEVTSHGLAQGRVEGVEFDTAVFTNLSHEHLDYHMNMKEYARAKRRLFTSLRRSEYKDPVVVVNNQDPWAEFITEGAVGRFFTYAIEAEADLVASDVQFHSGGTSFILHFQGEEVVVQTRLLGRFNVENCLAAASVFLARGYALVNVARGLTSAKAPPGRLEKVDNALDLHVYVDHAHKEEALRNVLRTIRETTNGKIITVFGCGGDRDRLKRPKMAQAVEELSDIAVVTSDNPRSEDPSAIIQEVCSGFTSMEPITAVCRREAIYRAIELANPDDCILIAGRGHEKRQIFDQRTIDFDDCVVARECCQQLSTKRLCATSSY